MLAALGSGRCVIRDILESEDVKSTAAVLRVCGWDLPQVSAEMVVQGRGLRSNLSAPREDLDCGNSGTTTRLMAGIAAAQPFASTFRGDASLCARPMGRVADPLVQMGARVEWLERGDRLPMRIHGGRLKSVSYTVPVPSAQVKSAVLLAGLCAGVEVRVEERVPTRDHTERMLSASGVSIAREGTWITLAPVESITPPDVVVPGDPSSAAFIAALAVLAQRGSIRIENVLASEHRDGFMRALRIMGADITMSAESRSDGTEAADIVVSGGRALKGIELPPDLVPSMIDELPTLAIVASRAEGQTVVRHASELRFKESDRIAATVSNLRAVGVTATELPDGFVITGTDAHLSGKITTHGDHRIAMAFGVLATSANTAITVDDPRCVNVSYPGFWSDMGRLAHE